MAQPQPQLTSAPLPSAGKNETTLSLIAAILNEYPDLFCEVKGTTSGQGKREADPNLAKHFRLDATRDYKKIMDRLAEERALACRKEVRMTPHRFPSLATTPAPLACFSRRLFFPQLIRLGVAETQLLDVSFEGCTGEQKVDFIPRATKTKRQKRGAGGDGDDSDDDDSDDDDDGALPRFRFRGAVGAALTDRNESAVAAAVATAARGVAARTPLRPAAKRAAPHTTRTPCAAAHTAGAHSSPYRSDYDMSAPPPAPPRRTHPAHPASLLLSRMGKTADDDEYMAAEAAAMKVGDRCVVSLAIGATKGKVQYVGKIPTIGKGWWIGVQYDEAVGKNDGSVKGERFFTCPPNYGGFLRPDKVRLSTDAAATTATSTSSAAAALTAAAVAPKPAAAVARPPVAAKAPTGGGGIACLRIVPPLTRDVRRARLTLRIQSAASDAKGTAVTAASAAGAPASAGIVVGVLPLRHAVPNGGGGGDDDGAFAFRCADGMRKLPGKRWDSFAMEARARAPKGGLYSDGDEITLEFDRRRRELRVTDGRDGKAISQRLKKDSVLAKTLDHDGEF